MAENIKYKLVAAAILIFFSESAILGCSDPNMANIYQRTKFEANISVND